MIDICQPNNEGIHTFLDQMFIFHFEVTAREQRISVGF